MSSLSRQSIHKIIAIVLSLSFLLWLATISAMHITRYPASAFYYFQLLPVFYWAGMVLLAATVTYLALARNRQILDMHLGIDLAIVLLLALYLFGTTSFAYDNPRFYDVYGVIDLTNQLTEEGGTKITGMLGYLNSLPGAILFFSALSMLAGVSTTEIARYYTIYLMILLSIITYCIARRITKRYAFLSPVCLLSLSWVQEYHMAPQSYALILYALFWMVLLLQLENKKNSYRYLFLLLIGLIALIVAHPLTPIILLINLLLLIVVDRSLLKRNINILLFAVLLVGYAGWLAYCSSSYFYMLLQNSIHIVNIIQNILLHGWATAPGINYSLSNSQSDQVIVDTLRKAVTVSELLLGIICGVYAIVNRGKSRLLYSIMAIWFASCLVFQAYSSLTGIIFGRMLIFIIFPFSVLILLGFTGNKAGDRRPGYGLLNIAILGLVIASAFLMPLTNYGGDYSEFVPDSWLTFTDFSEDHEIAAEHNTLTSKKAAEFIEYSDTWYNFYQVKSMRGSDYLNLFNSNYSQIYDSRDSRLYLPRNSTRLK